MSLAIIFCKFTNFLENFKSFTRKALKDLFATLTRISLASFLWDICKQCKTRSDVAKCDV